MLATVRDAPRLKDLAAVSRRGRPVRKPFYFLTLSWQPGYVPTYLQMDMAAEGALDKIGLVGHQAVWLAPNDKPHSHIYVAASRIHWETGRAVRLSHEHRKLSRWACEYEQALGDVVVPARLRRQACGVSSPCSLPS